MSVQAMPVAPADTVPEGWDLLPAGPERLVRVYRDEIGHPDGKPFTVIDQTTSAEVYTAGAKVLGEAEFLHDAAYEWCGKVGIVEVRTTAAILVRR